MDDSQLFSSFQEAYRLKAPEDLVLLKYVPLDKLVVTTDHIVACDPYYCSTQHPVIAEPISPGAYPVTVAVAQFANTDQRVAFAAIQLSGVLPTVWKPATSSYGDDLDGSGFAYGVDSGMGAFLDAGIADAFAELIVSEEQTAIIEDVLTRSYVDTWNWANILVDQATNANVICFSSGWGDGRYFSYFGYDNDAQPTCLLTDFGVLEQETTS